MKGYFIVTTLKEEKAMQRLHLIFIFLGAFLLCSFLNDFGLHPFVLVLIMMFYLFLFTMLPQIYTIFGTRNIQKIDRFLSQKQTSSLYSHFYIAIHDGAPQQKKILEQLLQNPVYEQEYPYFKSLLLLLEKRYDAAFFEAEKIQKAEIRYYTLAQIEIEHGNHAKASDYIHRLQSKWRRDTLLALQAFSKQQLDEFIRRSSNALKRTRGIEYYMLYHLFEKLKPSKTFNLPFCLSV